MASRVVPHTKYISIKHWVTGLLCRKNDLTSQWLSSCALMGIMRILQHIVPSQPLEMEMIALKSVIQCSLRNLMTNIALSQDNACHNILPVKQHSHNE
jgi:hypothetical protein